MLGQEAHVKAAWERLGVGGGVGCGGGGALEGTGRVDSGRGECRVRSPRGQLVMAGVTSRAWRGEQAVGGGEKE